jgi:exopolysaccharide production protein ExoQ
MPPTIASLCCALFILWLFVQDKRRHKVSIALWLPLTWMFIIGSKPISLWFGYADTGSEGYVEGSPFDRLIFFFLIAAGWFVLVRRGIHWPRFFQKNRWLWIYFLYLGISVLWSDYPFVSFKRWIKDIGNVIMVLVVLTENDPLQAVKALLARCAFLLIPLSVLLVKYYSEIGRYYDEWTYQPYFCGVTTDKNLLGMSLFVCGVSLFWLLLELRPPRVRPRDKMEFYTCLFLMVMTLWLLVKAQSSTALSCTVLGCSILLGMKFPVIRSKARWLGAYSIGAVILGVFLNATLDLGGVFVQVFGRDLTFTGRTDIWAMLLKEPINPLFGEGFYSFWMGDRVERLSEKYFYHLNEAHNGYLETYLNSGLLGLGLLCILLASVGGRIQRAVMAGSGFGSLQLAFLVSNIIYNVTEAVFDRLDLLWFCLLLVIVEYPSQIKAGAGNAPESFPVDLPRSSPAQNPADAPTVAVFQSANHRGPRLCLTP